VNAGPLPSRIHAFERELARRCSSRTEGTAFGTAFLHEDFPLRYDSNYVWVERDLAGVDADALAVDADRVMGEIGLTHREIRVDDDDQGRRLAPGFAALGWTADRIVSMAQVRQPEPRPAIAVRETDLDGARSVIEEEHRRRAEAGGEEATAQLTAFRGVLEREAAARFFVAEADGRPASVCELYVIDGVGQVEDVDTLEEFRGRGLGSAVVLAAARSARDRGCDLVFLCADEDDWPKELYRRLGFDPVGRFWSFLRAPGA
jgi:ribosomal protein S18 acetylase RimI-like enzyme